MTGNKPYYILFFWLVSKKPKVQVLAKSLPSQNPTAGPLPGASNSIPTHLYEHLIQSEYSDFASPITASVTQKPATAFTDYLTHIKLLLENTLGKFD